MKKLISLILAICMLASIACISASASGEIASGELEGFTWTVSADGTLDIEGSGLMPRGIVTEYSKYAKFITNVVIGEGILDVANSLLAYYDYPVTTVQLPSTLLSIGDSAFAGCESLQTINFPESLRSIGEVAFSGCSSLKSVVIPEGVTTIEQHAFYGCTSLTSVKLSSKTTTICHSAFGGCTALRSIEFPETLTALGTPYGSAFSGCKALLTVTIPGNVGTVSSSAFNNCTSLKTAIVSEGVTTLDEWVFHGCSSLKAVYIPSTVTSIGALCFAACNALTDVYYGGSQAQWYLITFDSNQNNCLTKANIHYNSVPSQASLGAQFSDVNYSDWYCDTVSWAVATGTAEGNSATTFNPKGTLTVAGLLQMLYNEAGKPSVSTTENKWYSKACAWAISEGFIDSSVNVMDKCTRLMVVEMMYKAAGSPAVSGTAPFSDITNDAVTWAYQNNITQGSNGLFMPDTTLIRATAVTFISNMINAAK